MQGDELDFSIMQGEIHESESATAKAGADPLLPPPLLFLGLIGCGIAAQIYWPLEDWVPWWARLLGLLGAFVAFRWGASAVNLLKEHETAVSAFAPSTTLLSQGPFARSRNPIYASLTICHLCTALIADNPWIVVSGLLYFLLLHPLVIAYEEAHLHSQFGEAFVAYKHQVNRWF